MILTPLPPGAPPALLGMQDGVRELSEPTYPHRVFACATADMPPAADYTNCILRNTTLNILAVSDGVDWIRQDTGAAI